MKRYSFFPTFILFSGCGLLTVSAQTSTVTNGAGGDLCESGQRVCLAGEATCENDVCVCNGLQSGQGNFACYQDLSCEIKNDPQVITFAGERVEVPLPCRYLLTHVMPDFSPAVQANVILGTCQIKVYSYSLKVRGKFFVYGFDAYINIFNAMSGKNRGASIRKIGTANAGTYTFQEWGKDTSDENAPWSGPASVNAFGQRLECTIDTVNNRAIVDIPRCGFKLTFRPADITQGKDQTQMPGISISLLQTDSTTWLSRNTALALPIFDVGPTVGSISNTLDLAPEEAFLTLALIGAASQNFPNAPAKCNDAVTVMSTCTDTELRKEALEMCSFILMWPTFVRCWCRQNPVSADPVLDLFARCVDVICNEKVAECISLVQEVSSNKICGPKALDEFTGFMCMF